MEWACVDLSGSLERYTDRMLHAGWSTVRLPRVVTRALARVAWVVTVNPGDEARVGREAAGSVVRPGTTPLHPQSPQNPRHRQTRMGRQ